MFHSMRRTRALLLFVLCAAALLACTPKPPPADDVVLTKSTAVPTVPASTVEPSPAPRLATPTPSPAPTLTATPAAPPTSTSAPAAAVPPPRSTPTARAAASTAALRYDPAARRCAGAPAQAVQREWEAQAPRTPSPRSETIALSVRNRDEYPARYRATARVTDPDGVDSAASVAIRDDDWGDLDYPAEFAGARPLTPGTYTVVWEIEAGFILCDGFQIR